jgi:1-acyl-sn-glycerol-3-phosphate acyltransferase
MFHDSSFPGKSVASAIGRGHWPRPRSWGISPRVPDRANVTPNATPVEELERRIVTRFGKRFVRALSFSFHRLRVKAPCPIPPRGGGILVCNHTSSIDPIFLQAACPRLITWMMAREYASIFGLKWFFNSIEPILVERSGRDMAATRAALRALKDGKILGLFPEGRIEKTNELLPFQTGIALLAIKSSAPIYPGYLDGSQRGKDMIEPFLLPQDVTVNFGPPIQLDAGTEGRERLESATQQIRDAVAALG